ncbi:MAG: hypothetical protein PHC85_01520 [Candidatus Pacebacteria bacterium]|nr:hypothetical protein [Candidatus Paceibacterota bacterium]
MLNMIRKRLGAKKEENLPAMETKEKTFEQMKVVCRTAKNFIDALEELEELHFCKCGELFLCRHKKCPECGEPNPKYRPFAGKDQERAENMAEAALDKLRAACKAL